VAVVVTAEVPPDLFCPPRSADTDDRCVAGILPRKYITRIERFDVSDLWEDTKFRWRRLSEFGGLLDWPDDDIVQRPDNWEGLLARLDAAEDAAAREHFHATGYELSEWRDRHDEGAWADV
jgi:hypothetical protein